MKNPGVGVGGGGWNCVNKFSNFGNSYCDIFLLISCFHLLLLRTRAGEDYTTTVLACREKRPELRNLQKKGGGGGRFFLLSK